MSTVPKGKRGESKVNFDNVYYRIHSEAVQMIEQNFHARDEVVECNGAYIRSASDALMNSVWDLIHHVKVANSIYPTTLAELTERRIEQDRAIGVCFDILTLYELVMNRLKVRDDLCVEEIKTIRHEINSIKKWRESDNKRFRNLKSSI